MGEVGEDQGWELSGWLYVAKNNQQKHFWGVNKNQHFGGPSRDFDG